MKSETLVAALRILANDIQLPDDVPATCLREAADRLEELQWKLDIENKRADGHYENYCGILKQIDRIANQRDKAWDEVERLKAELSNLQPKTTRPEPSRLEIAAMLKAGWFCNFDNPDALACPPPKWWIEQADALIAAAREGK
jgi:hypothetical protein